ncbi:hypothetical protein [Kordia sp.]|uniref:hypothetical protein n=1 Tax=Kordia sp. TaxID=1965332 RepID=UPI003D2C5A2C
MKNILGIRLREYLYLSFHKKKNNSLNISELISTPNLQSSNFLVEDLKAISQFAEEHAALLIAS